VQGKITSRSLAAFLKSEVPRRAALYQRTLNPTVIASFPDGDDYYFDRQAGPAAPAFPPWPAPGAVAGIGTGMGAEMLAIDADAVIVDDAHIWHRPVTKDGVTNAGKITELLGAASEEKGAAAGRVGGRTGHAAPAPEQTLRARMAQGQGSPISGLAAGFAVDGAQVQAVWAPRGVRAARQDAQTGLWRVEREDGQPLQATAPVLVQFADGLFAALAIMPRFVASLFRDARGVAAIVYRNVDSPDEAIDTTEALARLDSGALRADVVIDLAVMLRQAKHADPVLGVISAYLYDAIGDLESIRRMAYFYVYHGQPIPYDIALLAQLPGRRQGEGLWADVPALPKRAPRSDAEFRNNWTYAATPAAGGPVGGLWPWMRQGWVFLDHPDDSGSNLILPGLIELRSGMTGSRFATFDEKAGLALAQRFGLEQGS
jgi:hypothetical protein